MEAEDPNSKHLSAKKEPDNGTPSVESLRKRRSPRLLADYRVETATNSDTCCLLFVIGASILPNNMSSRGVAEIA